MGTVVDNVLERALAAYQRGDPATCAAALDAEPDAWIGRADGWLVRGVAARALGRPAEAEAAYRQAITLHPQFPEAWQNLGNLLASSGRQQEAVEAYRQSLARRVDPKERAALLVLIAGSAFSAGLIDDALAAMNDAVSLDPVSAGAHNQRGKVLWELGHTDAAVDAFRRAQGCDPANPLYATNGLLVSQFAEGLSEADLAALARVAAERIVREVPASLKDSFRAPGPTPDGRIRIAYLSSDFRATAPGFFIRAILAGHDRHRFDVWALSTSGGGDDWTAKLRQHVDQWHDVAGLGTVALTEWIRANGIQILVDLNGYTGGHRLGVFAARAAAVQVSWLGYEGTTGLAGMDAVLGDPAVTSVETEPCYTEAVHRLPFDFACYWAPDYAPEVAPLPATRAGYVTFGSFNKLAKLGRGTLGLWARVLHAVPGSRLLLKWRHATHPFARDRVLLELAAHGIGADRVEFRDASPHADMLAEYGDVDIALDPFPFSGGATTCDALWMGVPVVTLRGQRFASNHTVSHLHAAGLPHLIGATQQAYVDICRRLATDIPGLGRLRATLREQLRHSPLCEHTLFMRPAERVFEALYERSNSAALTDFRGMPGA